MSILDHVKITNPVWRAEIAKARTPVPTVNAPKPVATTATAEWRAWVDAMNQLPGIFAYFEPMPNWVNEKPTMRLAASIKRFQHRWANQAVCEWLTTVPQLIEPVTVTMTRYGVKILDDDGLAAALKHFQDGAAAALGIDDGKADRIKFVRQQVRGAFYGIRLVINGATA